MAKKKKKDKNKLQGIDAIKAAMEAAEMQGVAVVVLGTDGQIMIGSEGLDRDTCQSLLAQSAELMAKEMGYNQTLH